MTPIQAAETILQCMAYITQQFESNYGAIGELNNQQTDLLHDLELGPPLRGARGHTLAKKLREVRIARRVAKDENEVAQGLYNYISTGSSQAFQNGLINALSKARTREKQLEERFYTPRSDEYRPEEQEDDNGLAE